MNDINDTHISVYFISNSLNICIVEHLQSFTLLLFFLNKISFAQVEMGDRKFKMIIVWTFTCVNNLNTEQNEKYEKDCKTP